MLSFNIGNYIVNVAEAFPVLHEEYQNHAALADIVTNETEERSLLCLSVQRCFEWPFLYVTRRYDGACGVFTPGVIIIPETSLLVIGAGEHLLAYKLNPLEKLWEDSTEFGFLHWERYADYIIMSGELELAVWDIHGVKLWTTFVEPPWEYTVHEGIVHLDMMGKKSSFSLQEGPIL